MRPLYLLLFLLGLTTALSAQQTYLPPQQPATLYDHLYQINEAWLSEVSPNEYLTEVQFGSDVERIQRHLQLVEGILRNRSVTHLSYDQQLRRTKTLNHLRSYWQAAQFPINRHHPGRIPIFIDDNNTACAVGHLMLETGAQSTAYRIRAENNFADIVDLLAYEEVPAWGIQNGFTAQELAWIQPAYSVVYFTAEPFGNNLGLTGGAILTMLEYNDELYLGGSFEGIDGTSVDKIAIWDGTTLRTLPGLGTDTPGGITRMAIDETTGELYAIGTFYTFPNAAGVVLLVRYRDGQWQPLLDISETDATTFNDLACRAGYCYLTGDFTHLQEDNAMAAMAVLNTNTDEWSPFHPDWTFSGWVNDLDIENEELIIGGAFQILEDESVVAEDLALFDLGVSASVPPNLLEPPYLATGPIQEILFVDTDHSVGTAYRILFEDDMGPAFAYGQQTLYGEHFYNLEEEPDIHGIADSWGMVYGRFPFTFAEAGPYVLLSSPGESASPYFYIAQANGAVTSVSAFQDKLVIAGDFTQIDGVDVNQLAIADLLISDTEDVSSATTISVQTDGSHIILDDLPQSTEGAIFELFDAAGRRVWFTQLTAFDTPQVLDPVALPAATYVYRLLVDGRLQAGQLALLR